METGFNGSYWKAKRDDNLLLNGKELKRLLDFIKSKKNDKRLELTYGCPSFLGLDYEKEVEADISIVGQESALQAFYIMEIYLYARMYQE